MDKFERILDTLEGNKTDRPPISLWQHHPLADHKAKSLANVTIEYYRRYDLDMVKVCPFALHCVADFGAQIVFPKDGFKTPRLQKPLVRKPEDFEKIKPHDASSGFLGEMVEAIRLIGKGLDGEAPFLQTVFSPLMTLMYMTDNAIFSHMRIHPEPVHKTLRTVTNATIDYLERSLDAGATGIFFATKAASFDFLSKREFDEFGRRYDSEVLRRAKKAEIVVLHLHGKNIMFDDLLDYPNNVINWHDRRTSPTLDEARRKTKKCLLGGINEEALPAATPNQIKGEVKDAMQSVECGLVVGPGCVIPPATPHENIMAARRAID